MIATGSQTPTDFLAGAGEMGERIRAFDWKSTPLGPIEAWPQSLKTSVSLILSSRHPMWIGWGPEMTFLYNDAYLHVLGPAKHPAALGRPASVVWAEIWDVCGPLADKVFQQGEASFVDDVRLFMDRGGFLEETFYSFSYSPIRDEFGQVSGLFCPSTDVTPKVLNARRLRTLSELAANALAEKTAAAACASTAAVLNKNPDDIPFALLYLADSGGQGAALECTAGSIDSSLLDTEPLALDGVSTPLPWPVAQVFRSEKQQTVSVRGIAGLPYGVAGQPVSDAVVLPVASPGEHKPHGVLVTGVNPNRPLDAEYLTFFELVASQAATAIQSAKQVEEEKKRADMLAELDHAKTVFFSNVSHEFRTPLTLMLGPLETLLAKPDALRPEDREHLVIAHRNSLRLLKLVNSLLDFSRIEAGRVKASFVPTDLSDLTLNLASNFRSAVQAAGLKLEVDCPALPEPVYVDREMWEKIVLNLLSNAFKFTFAGTIGIKLRTSGTLCVLTVSDTGIGISEEELPHIFERFHRVESARGRTYEGTGIGLALVQELVQLHGGSIAVSSRPGEGSTFTLTLPLGSAHLPAERVGNASRTAATSVRVEAFTGEALTWVARDAAAEPRTRAEGKPRILLADDNADMREHVTRILGSDYDIVTADDGQQALQLIRQDPPDLLLTDIMMPGLDGFGLLRAVRSAPETRTLPVIFVSARAGEEMRVEGLEAGADDYLVKPFTANELRARVGTNVQMALARRQATEREAKLRAEAEAARDEAIRILESITDAFVALDSDWRFTYVNGEAERLNGLKREEMLGRSHWELYQDAVGTTIHRELLRVGKDRVAAEFENYYAPWNRWFHVKAYPAAGGGVSVFYEDITARKSAEEKLAQSERHFREVIDALPAAIYTTDAAGRLRHFNPAAVELSGQRPELGEFWSLAALRQSGGGKSGPGAECAGERPDGSRFSFVPYRTPLRDASGQAVGDIHMLVDITARKAAEEALRQSEERFRGVFESSAVGVAVLDLNAGFLQANQAFCAIVGYTEAELRSLDYAAITHPQDRPEMLEKVGALASGRTSQFVLEKRFVARDGGLLWAENSVSLMRDAEGRPEHIIALCQDVSARRQAEAALRESEERFRAIVETTPGCVKLVAADGTLLHMNSSGLRMVGADTADSAIGRNVYNLIAPEFRERYVAFNEAVCSGQRGSIEFDIVGLKGERRHMETHAAPLHDRDGSIVQLAITHDVSERRKAERAMMLLGAIVDSSDDAIVSKDLNGIITSWNKGAERLFGYLAPEAIGKSITILIPPDRLSEEPDILVRLQRGERVDHFETIRRRKDGSLINVSLTISPVKDARGKVIGASKIARDITERCRSEAELRRVNQDLEQFAYSASHDLQEPLRGVKIYTELLSRRYGAKLDGQALEFLGYVRGSASRMELLIHDLLTYTQVTRLDPPGQSADANSALADTLADLSGAIRENGAQVTADPLPALPVHGTHLKQLFQNLIGNAIKYRSPERRPVVHLGVERQDGNWIFSVADNGIGIEPEYRERIFGLFKRLHSGEDYAGTGIGLAICQRIVERYHGRIWVESEPGKGSKFIFTLPD